MPALAELSLVVIVSAAAIAAAFPLARLVRMPRLLASLAQRQVGLLIASSLLLLCLALTPPGPITALAALAGIALAGIAATPRRASALTSGENRADPLRIAPPAAADAARARAA